MPNYAWVGIYLGVVQDTPVLVRVAFVISTCSKYEYEYEYGVKEVYNTLPWDQNKTKKSQGIKMTGETPEVRFNKRKQREETEETEETEEMEDT